LPRRVNYPRKENIYLNELDEAEITGFNDFVAIMNEANQPICVNAYGDSQCMPEGECVAAIDTERSSLSDNKKVFDRLKEEIIPSQITFTEKALKILSAGLIDISKPSELVVENFGVCAYEERSSFEQFKAGFADALGLDKDDPNLVFYMAGLVVVVLLIFRLLAGGKR
jgi:hypothetical protein